MAIEHIQTTQTLETFLKQLFPEKLKDTYSAILKGALELQKEAAIDPLRVVAAYHDLNESIVQANPDTEISCKKGCSACCSTVVMVSSLEGIYISEIAKAKKIEIDSERLDKQASVNELDWYKELSFEERKCVFLSDSGECRIYNNRPMVCRNFMVTSDPKACITSDGEDSPVEQSLLYRNEIIASVFITAFPSPNTLPQHLKKNGL